ncbi:hypothetical protein ACG6R3_002796 [Enterococcus faecium]
MSLESAVDEIERVLIGNKDRGVEEVYLKNAIRSIETHLDPQLNHNQKALLEDLKHVYSWQHSHAWDLFYYLVNKDTSMFEWATINNFHSMPDEESLQVQILFSQWVLEQGSKHECTK